MICEAAIYPLMFNIKSSFKKANELKKRQKCRFLCSGPNLIKGGLFILIKNGQLLRTVTQSDEDLMLSEKRTAIIYTDASVKEIGKDKYRSGIGLAVLFRKKDVSESS